MKKLFLIFLFLLIPSMLFAAGSGTLGDPYTTVAELNTAIDAASAGDTIYLASGTYNTTAIDLSGTGAVGNHIVISVSDGAVEDLGGAVITDDGCLVTGSYQTLKGFHFNGSDDGIDISTGDYNLITQCKFTDIGDVRAGIDIGSGNGATHNTISYCTFEDTGSWQLYMIRHWSDETRTGNTHTHIHHCVFLNHQSLNNAETIQIAENLTQADIDQYCTIEYNYFYECRSDGETISIKCSSNIARHNWFYNPTLGDGALTIRWGEDNEIYGNFFYTGVNHGWVDGIRVHDGSNGSPNLIYNNYLEAGSTDVVCAITLEDGNHTNTWEANYCLIANNVVIGGRFGIRQVTGTYTANNNAIINNICHSATNGGGTNMYNDLGSDDTFTTNLSYCPGGNCDDGTGLTGVDSCGAYIVSEPKSIANLPFQWNYPSSYTNGTYNANVTIDIQGQTRANPPDIGHDEDDGVGNYDQTIEVGCTWDGTTDIIQLQTGGLSAVITGTAQAGGVTEAEIVTGGETIIITLTNETWVATVGDDNAITTALIAGIDSGGSEVAGWDAVVKANMVFGDVTRTNNAVVTITLGAEATYAITTNETITVTIPATALTGGTQIVATPTFEITALNPAAALTGTLADNATEAQIVTGGETIIITLTDDTWVAAGVTFDGQRQNIIDGMDSDGAEAGGWDIEIKGEMTLEEVVRTNDTVVTITMAAYPGYDISANESITITIPASALVTSGSPVVATPQFAIIFFDTATEETVGITMQ